MREKLYKRLRGRPQLSGRFSACFAGISGNLEKAARV